MHVTAIVLAAGRGIRLNFKTPKPLIKINSRPLIIYSLKLLGSQKHIKDIIVVANTSNRKGIISKIRQYKIGRIKAVVLGGRLRQDSVRCGLKVLDRRTDLILIHDAARPLVDKRAVSSVIKEAEKYGAAILGIPVKATIKKVTGTKRPEKSGKLIVEHTLNRKDLWEIQTPQVFRKELILKAYKKFSKLTVTDDASLVERLGVKVRVVEGSPFNIKITTSADLTIAKSLVKFRRESFK